MSQAVDRIPGIHHITAIAGDPQSNLDFYARTLGFRLVKLTVNFDDPGTYHFYFADEVGTPGSVLTFFPWAGAHRGRRGTGQASVISFAVAQGALDYWEARLTDYRVAIEPRFERFGEQVLPFSDPDGLSLELIATPRLVPSPDRSDAGGSVPSQAAIQRFAGVTLWVRDAAPTLKMLVESLGFRPADESAGRSRLLPAMGMDSGWVDVVTAPDPLRGVVAVGTVHHVAWRTADDEQQAHWRASLLRSGFSVTPVQDRQYFHSIYFREPGGVLFEIATDVPGFATDETVEQLGSTLRLPIWLEPQRSEIERKLPALRLPVTAN